MIEVKLDALCAGIRETDHSNEALEPTMHRHDRELIMQIAHRVFGDPGKARDWLNHPRVQLGGRTPMEMLVTETGARRVEELLTQIEDDKHLGID